MTSKTHDLGADIPANEINNPCWIPVEPCDACGEVACICPPRIEHTEAGAQVLITGTPERTIPATPTKPRRAQSTKPLELEMPAINAAQLGLF